MKKKIYLLFFFTVLFCIPVLFFCEGNAEAGKISMEEFEVDGYTIDVSVQQKNGKIMIRGRISYGPLCDRLKINFSLENEDGKKQKISETVDDVGGSGSRTIRTEKKLAKGNISKSEDIEWEITNVTVSCKK